MEKAKKSIFETPLLSTKIKSANAKLFPEGVLGYFIGPTLALIANSVLSGYFNMYMSNVLGISNWANWFFTWLPVVSVVMVILGNILVGRLMDHMKTRAGKARPLLLISIPIAIVALLVLFVFSPLPKTEAEQTTTLVLIAIGYNLWFAIAYPVYYTSHAALVNLSTRNSKSRSLLATISNATALAAMGLCTMILPFFLGMLFVYQTNPEIVAQTEGAMAVFDSSYVNGLSAELKALFDMDYFAIPVGLLAAFGGTASLDMSKLSYYTNASNAALYDQVASYNHWKVFVIALMVVLAVGAFVEYFFTRERITEESFKTGVVETKKKATPIGKQAKICFKDKFWIIMIVFFFLYQFGGMIKNVSQLYYCQAMFPNANGVYTTVEGGIWSGQLAIYGAIPTALGMVIAWPLANKIGKGKAILFGAILSTIGGAIGFIAPENFIVVTASFIIKALGSTPAMYLSLALLADILDHQEAQHGVRTDGLTMTIYGAIMAGMTGITTGILNAVLVGTGYDAIQGVLSTESMRTAMPWVFIGGETICYAVIALIFVFMGVEKFSKFDHKAIIIDQKAVADAEGVEYVDPDTKLAQEEAEAMAASEEARIAELKATCEKKKLDFEQEEAKYQASKAEREKAAEAKKAAAAEKKAAAEKVKQEKYDALSDEQKAAIAAKQAKKAEKQAAAEAKALKEFNALREKFGKPVLSLSDETAGEQALSEDFDLEEQSNEESTK